MQIKLDLINDMNYQFIFMISDAGLQDGERMESVDSFKLFKIE